MCSVPTLIYGPLSPDNCFPLLVAAEHCTCYCFSPCKKHLDRSRKKMSKRANKWITVIVWGSFRTLSWRTCWKWFCACRSMSLTSVSSAAFSLQTQRTFLERDVLEREELKLIWIIKMWTRRGFMFMSCTWESSALVVCEVPLHDRRSGTPGGGVSVNTASRSASALTSYSAFSASRNHGRTNTDVPSRQPTCDWEV